MNNVKMDSFIKKYADKNYKYPTLVSHKGAVIGFAMDSECRIWYTVLDLAHGDDERGHLDVNYWSDDLKELQFTNEIAQSGFSIAGSAKIPRVKKGTRTESSEPLASDELDYFLSSTARFTADAPFQVISDNKYLYLFRQSIEPSHLGMTFKLNSGDSTAIRDHEDLVKGRGGSNVPLVNNTLLCDRFVLSDINIFAKQEVRFRRSGHKSQPDSSKDCLGSKDMSGNVFFEPTQELDFISNLRNGQFNVLLLPTQVAENNRWQFFSYNKLSHNIDLFNLKQSEDGLFDTKGEGGDDLALNKSSVAFNNLSIETGISTTLYYQQEKHKEQNPLKKSARIMMCTGVKEEANSSTFIANLDFAVSRFGLLTTVPENITLPKINLAQDKLSAVNEYFYMDDARLTVSGSVLGFAQTDTSPYLFDSATGDLSLYFKDEDNKFSCAYYDTNLTRNHLTLSAGDTTIVTFRASVASENINNSTIHITDEEGNAGLCRVLIPNSDIRLPSEIWNKVPRESLAFAQTLNGINKDYDYKKNVSDNNTLLNNGQFSLHKGSLLFSVSALESGIMIQNGQAETVQTGTSSKWKVDEPGMSRHFNGDGDHFYLPQSQLESTQFNDELTVETWIKPDRKKGASYIVDYNRQDVNHATEERGENSSLSFDGKHDYIEMPYLDIDYSNGFTFETWVYFDGFNTRSRIIELSNGPGIDNIVVANIDNSNDLLLLVTKGPDTHRLILKSALDGRSWLHLAITFDCSGFVTVYKNGSEIGTKQMALPNNLPRSQTYIGKGTDAELFYGKIDEFRIWTYARTAEEIKGNKDNRLTGYEPCLSTYLCFSDNKVKDLSWKNISCVVKGQPESTLASPVKNEMKVSNLEVETATNLAQRTHGAMSFDGINDYIEISDVDLDYSKGFALETWVYFDNFNNHSPIMEFGNGATSGQSIILSHIGTTSDLIFRIAKNQRVHDFVLRATLEKNCWLHLAFSFDDSGFATAYKNGTKIGQQQMVLPDNLVRRENYIAKKAWSGAKLFNGKIDEFRLWGHTRSKQEILDNFQRRLPPKTPGLNVHLDFNADGATEISQYRNFKLTPHGAPKTTASSPAIYLYPQSHLSILDTPNTALHFDGVNDHIELSEVDFDYSNGFTIEAWLFVDRAENWSKIFELGNGGDFSYPPDNIHLCCLDNEGFYFSIIKNDRNYNFITKERLKLQEWMLLSISVDSSGLTTLYVNGRKVTSKLLAVPNNIPRAKNNIADGGLGYYGFSGSIDEFRIWDHCRTESEIKQFTWQRLHLGTEGLLTYLRFENNQAKEANGNRIDCKVVGSPRNSSSAPAQYFITADKDKVVQDSGYRLGLLNNAQDTALKLNGSSDFISLPGLDLDYSNGFTLETWVYYDELRNWSRIIDFSNNKSDNIIISNGKDNRALYINVRQGEEKYSFDCIDVLEAKTWFHLAVSFDKSGFVHVYKNGTLIGSEQLVLPVNIPRMTSYIGKSNWAEDKLLSGRLDELRIWDHVRTTDEINNNMHTTLSNHEVNSLLAYWTFENNRINDKCNQDITAQIKGNPRSTESAFSSYQIFTGVGNRWELSDRKFSADYWAHLAAIYKQSYALEFKQGDMLNVTHSANLNRQDALTIEAYISVNDINHKHTIISKGSLYSAEPCPYSLSIDNGGMLTFSFQDTQGLTHKLHSLQQIIQPNEFYRIAVTKRKTFANPVDGLLGKTGTINAEALSSLEINIPSSGGVDTNYNICLYVDDILVAEQGFSDIKIPGNNENITIGADPYQEQHNFMGIMSELRIWGHALTEVELFNPISVDSQGIMAYWKLDDKQGNKAFDSAGGNHAQINGACWIKNPDYAGNTLSLYMNGTPLNTSTLSYDHSLVLNNTTASEFSLGARRTDIGPEDNYKGDIDEIRIWKTARTQEQLLDNLFTRLTGEKQDLISYYTFNNNDNDEIGDIFDSGYRQNNLIQHERQHIAKRQISTAPVSQNLAQIRSAVTALDSPFHISIDGSPAVQEYADLQYGSDNELKGVMKRCYTYIEKGQWKLVTGHKVGNLITEWAGQAQFDPQIVGYMEGTPPIPSENMTYGTAGTGTGIYEGDGSFIEFTQATEVDYNYSASREHGFDSSFEATMSAGIEAEIENLIAPLGIGISIPARFGLTAGGTRGFESSGGWVEDKTSSIGTTITRSFSASLGGAWEDPSNMGNPEIGRRWLPASVGFAIVQSEVADIFALRLEHNKALVSYRFQPTKDVAKDWNVISFPLNPNYVKQGTIDGKMGYDKSGHVMCDPDYPNATQPGEHSYYKPKKAFALKRKIEREQQELATYYKNYGAAPLKNGPLNGAMKSVQGLSSALTANFSTGFGVEPTISSFNEAMKSGAASENLGLADKFSKRNIANTYIWTADGGIFQETHDTMDVLQETASGNYSFASSDSFNTQFELDVASAAFSLEMDASLSGKLNLTQSKSKESSQFFSIDANVTCSGDMQCHEPETGKPIYKDGEPVNTVGRMDAYRWMTFYLRSDEKNFTALYDTVIDPLWLTESSHPSAIALREARQTEKTPPCWRIQHIVTFASRILPDVVNNTAEPIVQAMKKININSNWELIKRLDPLIKNKSVNATAFSKDVKKVLALHMPEMLPHHEEVVHCLSDYYEGMNSIASAD